MLWMMLSRIGEFRRLGVTSEYPGGSRGVDWGPGRSHAQWKSHNYDHLMEQPTIFYAIALTLALMDLGGGINDWLAWAYVGFRVLHSLVQGDGQRRPLPPSLFGLASLCLLGLTTHAGSAILHDCGLIG